MRDHDAQPVGGIARRLAHILTSRGIDPAAKLTDAAEPIPALQAAEARIPARYQASVADHPAVVAWVREVAQAGRPGPEGAPGIAQGRSLLIVGTTGTGKTHQAYGAVRSCSSPVSGFAGRRSPPLTCTRSCGPAPATTASGS